MPSIPLPEPDVGLPGPENDPFGDWGGSSPDMYASLKSVTDFFPPPFSDIIARKPWPVSMRTSLGQIMCQIRISIAEDRLQHFARDLFRIRVEVKDGSRSVVFSDTVAKVIPSPYTVVCGILLKDLEDWFGASTRQAVHDCPRFQQQAPDCHRHTDCVALRIPRKSCESATLEICMGLWLGLDMHLGPFQE